MNHTLTLNPPILMKFRLGLNPRVLWILGLLLITALVVFYIFQVNAMTRELYLIRNYEQKIEGHWQENESLEISLLQTNSLEGLEAKIQNLNYEKIGQVHYIQVLESTVVAK